MGFLDKAKDAIGEAAEKVGDVAEKATDAIDEKTGGKLSETVDKVKDKLPTDKIPGMGGKDEPEADAPDADA